MQRTRRGGLPTPPRAVATRASGSRGRRQWPWHQRRCPRPLLRPPTRTARAHHCEPPLGASTGIEPKTPRPQRSNFPMSSKLSVRGIPTIDRTKGTTSAGREGRGPTCARSWPAGRLTLLAVDCGRSMSSRTVYLCILVPCLMLQGLALGLVPMSTANCCRPLTGRCPAVAVPRRAGVICLTFSSHAMWTHEFAVLVVIAMTTRPMC